MNLLFIPSHYPSPAAPYNGAQNERCAQVLRRLVDRIVVVSPRPFVPPLLAVRPRWKRYADIPFHSASGGIDVYRPACLVVPGLLSALWPNEGAYYRVRPLVGKLHRRHRFEAILSFDLVNAGGLAWRLGRHLGIPAAGWAIGGDMRCQMGSSFGRTLRTTLASLDRVFYQSGELLALGADFLGTSAEQLERTGRHRTLARGVIGPAQPPAEGLRAQVRSRLGVADDEVMVIYLGRIVRDKGLFGLVDAVTANLADVGPMKLVIVGAQPGFDETVELTRHLAGMPALQNRIAILPACPPEDVWAYLGAADLFAFPSLGEGMPNSLLEAMLSGLPAVAFDIPAIRALTGHDREALFTVAGFDYEAFFRRLRALADDTRLRRAAGARAKQLVERHFSMDHSMRVAVESLEGLIAKPRRGNDVRKVSIPT